MAPDFYGNVTAVRIIHQVLERNHDVVTSVLKAVYMVIDCNKAHPKSWEQPFNVLARINILTSEAGQVLHHHAVNNAPLYIFHHQLKLGTLEIGTGIPVVHPLRHDFNIFLVS